MSICLLDTRWCKTYLPTQHDINPQDSLCQVNTLWITFVVHLIPRGGAGPLSDVLHDLHMCTGTHLSHLFILFFFIPYGAINALIKGKYGTILFRLSILIIGLPPRGRIQSQLKDAENLYLLSKGSKLC